MKRKRSDGGVRVWWDSTDVKKIFIDQHLLLVFPLKTARLFNKKGRQTSPSWRPARVVWLGEEPEDGDLGRKTLYCPS